MTQSGQTTFDPLAVPTQTLDTPCSRVLAERIQRNGPITFAEWMNTCLYHPQHGYYRRGRRSVGRDGDFLTSPEIHPLFGAAIGHVAAELWRNSSAPKAFRVAEVGPGTGALAEALLRHLHATAPDLASATRYTLVEPDPNAATQQCDRLRSIDPSLDVHRLTNCVALTADQHLVLANELLDALPVHRLVHRDGRWQELFVNFAPERGFYDVPAELSDPTLLDPLRDIEPADGQTVEVSPARSEMVSALANAVADGGLLLLFDYGYPRQRLYAPWRRDGTLMTFRNHVPGDNPYERPGETDLTVHIDIDQAREAAQDAGLTPLPALNQAEWLHNLGAAVLPAVADSNSDTNRYLSARRAAETLTEPAGLGRVAVMGFTRGHSGPLPGWPSS